MSIQRIAQKALSAYARSKRGGHHAGTPVRNRPVRHHKVKRGRSVESQIASKAVRAIRRAL
ncbi:hypothetical protein [Salipiger bermudensis]|uniref:hypothetical protein n=1 Tax=Salipiger bermudensis TaxID=344736 RepID=UPI001A8D5815|nr:hypothetical protein [Salipiger bermudensis]MBN9676677.1 hypothetical protein [Salipiger bermudensis]